MEFVGPNVFVDGTTVSGPARRPNSEAQRAAYESKVVKVWNKIHGVAFGRAFLDIISNNPNPIVIAPSRDLENADATALNSARGFAPGANMPGPNGTVAGTGLGGGSTTVVHFNPDGKFSGIGADVTLLHEMLHAYRKACGRWNMLPMDPFVNSTNPRGERMRFENWEEWFSVVAEGVYGSEAGATSVRVAHSRILAMLVALKPSGPPVSAWGGTQQTDSQIFAGRYRPAILRILEQEPQIYAAMRNSTAWFNPVRDFEDALLASRI